MADIENLNIKITTDMSGVAESLKRVSDALRTINEQLDRIDPNRMDGFSKAAQSATDASQNLQRTVKDLGDAVQNVSQHMGGLSQVGDAAKNIGNELGNASRQTNTMTGALREAAQSVGSTNGSFLSLRNIVGTISKSLSSVTSHLDILGSAAKKAFGMFLIPAKFAASAVRKLSTSQHLATNTAKKFAKEIFRVSKMLKLMVTRMALRAVIKEVGNGFKSLALHSEAFNQSVSGMINGAKKLGYSFAAMVSPLINALAPAIIYVINLLVKLANVINQVFSALSGMTTYNRSKDFAEDWASNIESANKQAKQLKKTVLGFDELNQLQEKQTGGGDTSGNIVDMFETVEIDPRWKQFSDWLKEMWELADFTKLGEKLGKGLRDLLESIPWEMIRKTANKLGKSLATLINGFVEVEKLGYDIGHTIAQSVNTVFEFINGFVHNLHWDSIGKFIADTLNGFFEGIDWKLIKDTFVTGMKGLAEAIENSIETFHWDNISNFVINAIDTVSTGIREFIDGIDWQDLGVRLADQINKVLTGVDWHDIGETLGSILKAGIDWAYGLIKTFDVNAAVDAIEGFLKGVFEIVDTKRIGETLGTLLHKLIQVIQKFWQNEENRKMIKEEIKGFFDGVFNSMTASDFSFIAKGALALVVFTALKNMLKDAITKLATAEVVTSAAASTGTTIGSMIGSSIITGIMAVLGGNLVIKGALKIWEKAYLGGMEDAGYSQAEIDKVKADFDYLQERYTALNASGALLKDAFTGFKDVELPSDKIKECAIQVEDLRVPVIKLGEDGKALESDFKKGTDGVQSSVNAVSRSINKDTGQIKKDFDDIKITVEKDTEGIKNTANTINFKPVSDAVFKLDGDTKTAFNNASKTVADYSTEVGEVTIQIANSGAEMSGTWTELSKSTDTEVSAMAKAVADGTKDMTDSLDNVKDAMSEDKWTFDGVGDGLKKTFEKAKEGIKSVWNSIAEKLNGEYELGEGKFKIKLPKFAGGGFPENGLFLANSTELVGRFSNGRTAVANNEQIVNGISAGVYNAVTAAMANGSGSNNGGYIANTIVVDGEVIARTVTRAQQKQNMRYSPQMG